MSWDMYPDSAIEYLLADTPHVFDPGYTGMSTKCNHLVMRDGAGDDCGLPKDHPVHAEVAEAMETGDFDPMTSEERLEVYGDEHDRP